MERGDEEHIGKFTRIPSLLELEKGWMVRVCAGCMYLLRGMYSIKYLLFYDGGWFWLGISYVAVRHAPCTTLGFKV